MFCLNLIIVSQIVCIKEILCHVIPNFSDCSSAVDMVPPYVSESLGEVNMSSNNIPMTGVTTVDGSVPAVGTVNFDGEVRASGAVTIVATNRPASRPLSTAHRPLKIMLVPPRKYSNLYRKIVPIILRAVSISPQQSTAATPPTSASWSYLNPVSQLFRNLTVSSCSQEIATECDSHMVVSGSEAPFTGTSVVDGVSATSGHITFNGYLPAKGSVVIKCKSF